MCTDILKFIFTTENLTDVIIYSSPDDPKKRNRGFAFLEYLTHKDASIAKRHLGSGRTQVWNCDIIVDWADPIEEPDEETMAKVCFVILSFVCSSVSQHVNAVNLSNVLYNVLQVLDDLFIFQLWYKASFYLKISVDTTCWTRVKLMLGDHGDFTCRCSNRNNVNKDQTLPIMELEV